MKNLSVFNWSSLGSGEVDDEWFKFFKANSSWAMPQLMAFLNTNVKLLRNEDGKVSATLTLAKMGESVKAGEYVFDNGKVLSPSDLQGILKLLTYKTKSKLFKAKQTSKEMLPYNAAVPLFMSAFKTYRNLGYDEWDWVDPKLSWLLTENLLEAFKFTRVANVEFDKERLLAIREEATGGKDPLSVYTLRFIKSDKEFSALPTYYGLSLLQLWVFHPSCWSQYGVFDFSNPEGKPEALETTEIFKETTSNNLSPWD